MFLPDLRGYGALPDLHIAMSLDNTGTGNLLDLVADFQSRSMADLFTGDHDALNAVRDIMVRWAGADDVGADDRGQWVSGPELAFIEKLIDDPFYQHENDSTNPYIHAGYRLEEAFRIVLNTTYAKLAVQDVANDNNRVECSYARRCA